VAEDLVNKPKHYTAYGEIECKDIQREALRGYKGMEAFCMGNIIKYVYRSHLKEGSRSIAKAGWYLNEAVASIKKRPKDMYHCPSSPDLKSFMDSVYKQMSEEFSPEEMKCFRTIVDTISSNEFYTNVDRAQSKVASALERWEKLVDRVSSKDEKGNETVNHPKHYAGYGNIECKDWLNVMLDDYHGMEAYCCGNVGKYIWRVNDKDGSSLEKANWYINEAKKCIVSDLINGVGFEKIDMIQKNRNLLGQKDWSDNINFFSKVNEQMASVYTGEELKRFSSIGNMISSGNLYFRVSDCDSIGNELKHWRTLISERNIEAKRTVEVVLKPAVRAGVVKDCRKG
jgi:hypothetical protein